MNVKECYEIMGGDYEDMMRRMGTEYLICKFMLKFPEDESFAQLCDCMEQKKYEDAFRAVHTLKGVCLNLGFKSLVESSGRLVEALRKEKFDESQMSQIWGLLEQVKRDYEIIISTISKYKADLQ